MAKSPGLRGWHSHLLSLQMFCFIKSVQLLSQGRRLVHFPINGRIYLLQDQEQLEENYISGRGKCQFQMDGVTVIVDQGRLVQENTRTRQKSNIRRRPEFCGTDHKKDYRVVKVGHLI